MDINDVRIALDKAEDRIRLDIQRSVSDFESKTGLRVEDVHIRLGDLSIIGGPPRSEVMECSLTVDFRGYR